jgi:hypothetical protein
MMLLFANLFFEEQNRHYSLMNLLELLSQLVKLHLLGVKFLIVSSLFANFSLSSMISLRSFSSWLWNMAAFWSKAE